MNWFRRPQPDPTPAIHEEVSPVTFRYTDPAGDSLFFAPSPGDAGPAVSFRGVMRDTNEITVIHVPIDRLEEVIAGIRDAGRQAAQPDVPATPTPAVPPRRTPGGRS